MKIEKKKNYQRVQNLVRSFDESGDTILAICGIGNECSISFCGDVQQLCKSFYRIIKGGLSEEATDMQTALTSAMIAAMHGILSEDSEESCKFASILGNVFEDITDNREEEDGIASLLREILHVLKKNAK